MKRIIGLLTLVALLVTPVLALAADPVGVYVAPKFIYGYTQMDKQKGSMDYFDGDSFKAGFGSDNDNAFGGALAVGYDFGKRFAVPIRAELEYAAFSRVEAKGSKSAYDAYWEETNSYSLKQQNQIQTLFLNAYFDIKTGTSVTPYVGGGLGLAFINSKAKTKYDYVEDGGYEESYGKNSSSRMNTNFAWNVGAGLGWNMTENLTLDLGYRFVGLGSAKTDSVRYYASDYDPADSRTMDVKSKIDNLYMHQVMLALRLTF